MSIAPQPWPCEVTSVQPGGGPVQAVATPLLAAAPRLAAQFRPSYLARQRAARIADCVDCRHGVFDAVDLLAVRNVCSVRFAPAADVSP